jgi:hypothetical protein
MKLYHGSPYKLIKLDPQTPRGNNNFNTQTGVYLTSNKLEAALYSLARDKERKNKGWAIKNNFLYLVEDFWLEEFREDNKPFYQLNSVGYLHTIKTNNYEQNPYNSEEYIVKNPILVYKIKQIYKSTIKNNIIYISLIDFRKKFT